MEVQRQRQALEFVIANAFRQEAFGLDPDLLAKLAVDQWYDEGFSATQGYPIHDQVLAIQAVTLTMLINPTRLRRIQDNELRVPAGEDALTVPELLNGIREAIWDEPGQPGMPTGARYTDRNPMFSSIQRNLQREHLNRLIVLARGMRWPNASAATIATLARQQLREIRAGISKYAESDLDDYTTAHLNDSTERIDRALEAAYFRVD